jgi:AraC-like DNA-binding protein
MDLLAELRILIARHAVPGTMATAMPGLKVAASSMPTQIVHHVSEPAFAVIAQGAKRTVLGDKVIEYGIGQYVVVSVDLPISSHVVQASADEPFLAVGLMLKPASVAALLWETAIGERVPAELSGMGVSEASTELLEPMVRLLRLLDHPRDIPVLGPMIEREILWRLLTGEQGAMVRQIGLADSRLSQISHTIRWIRAHFAETFSIEELARLAAMSVSSFHRHFKAVTAMSPLQYQKQIRLQEARSRLLAESEDVAAVGFGVGYDSPSQFSREYSRLFGAPPGRDIAHLRTVSTLDRSVV